MLNRKKAIIFLLPVLAAVFITGCSRGEEPADQKISASTEQDMLQSNSDKEQEEKQKQEKQKAAYEFPEKYEKEVENISFQTEIILPEKFGEDPVYKTKAEQQDPVSEKLKEVLLGDIKITDYSEDEYTDNHGNKIKDENYAGEGDIGLNISNMIMYRTEFSQYVDQAFRLMNKENADQYEKNTDLSFKSIEDAYQDIQKKFSEMGYDLGDTDYQCYTLHYEMLEKEEYVEDIYGEIEKEKYKEKWSKEDDCYYFCIRQKVQGLPEYHPFADVFKSSSDENAPIQLIYSKDGIQKLEIEQIYRFQKTDEPMELVPFENAADAVQKKFSQILSDAKYTVRSARLYFMAENEDKKQWKMTPVWIFQVEETIEDEGIHNMLEVFVNAETGEEEPLEGRY